MTIESRKEKIIFYGIVPISAAATGAWVSSYLTSSACENKTLELVSIIRDSTMNGAQKLKAIEIYQDITNRPWSALSSLFTFLIFAFGSLSWAVSDWIRKK